MKKNLFSIVSLCIITTILLASCGKDVPTPTPENNQETITEIDISYVELNDAGVSTGDTSTIIFDASGVPTPEAVHLEAGKKYKTLIYFYDHDELLNTEISEEGTEHKIMFFPTQSGIFNYEYNDADENGNGIGLVGTTTVLQTGNISVNMLLRHGLNKNSSAAQGWNNVDYKQAGGEDDANVNFSMVLE